MLETLFEDHERVELRARDRTLAREVLLVRRKEVPLAGAAAGERVLREARALAGISHPSIQKLHDVVAEPAGTVLVLEPVTGEALAARLGTDGRLPPSEVRALGIALADALAAVHAAGAVHRDVSERNVLLRADGSPCLTGFRLAKPTVAGLQTSLEYGRKAGEGAPEHAGLPAHPAPEQLGGEAASARSDLFALGCVLYRALTGRAAQPEMLEHGWRAPSDPARLVPEVPTGLARLVLACLARSPVGRPRSAAELRDALQALASPASEARSSTRKPAGRRLVPGIAAGLVLLAALVGWRLFAGKAASPASAEARGLAAETASASSPGALFEPGFHRSHALLIGIGEAYRKHGFAPLANTVPDVEALEQALRALPSDRWETRLLTEDAASYDGIRAALETLGAALEPEDRVLVYYAGHGVPHERSGSSGWLIPADAETLETDPARTRWLHFDALDRFLKDASAKHVLLAMDCCYGGRLAASRSASARAYEGRFLTRPAKVVLAAGRADEPVSDGMAAGHSPFAQVFLDALHPGAGAITSSMLHAGMLRAFAEREVPQTPVLAFPPDVAPGEFVFLLD